MKKVTVRTSTNDFKILELLEASDVTGAFSLAAIGAVPNVYGATYAAGVFNLQPANFAYGGAVTAGDQDLIGIKKFLCATDASGADITRWYSNAAAGSASGTLRGHLEDDGSFAVFLNAAATEVGAVGLTTPNGVPGIVMYSRPGGGLNPLLGRSDMRHRGGGGFEWGALATGVPPAAAPTIQMYLDVSGRFVVDNTLLYVDKVTSRVGVGTNSAVVKFQVDDTASPTQALVNTTGAGWPAFSLGVDGGVHARFGVSRTLGDGITGAATGESFIRTQTKRFLISLDGGGTIHAYWATSGAYFSNVVSGTAAVNLLDGARLNFSTADASAYLYRSAANTLRTPGSLTVDTNGLFSGTLTATGTLAATNALTVGTTANVTGLLTATAGATFGARNTYKGITSITAFATGGQASATALTGEVNYVTTCATNQDSVKLPIASLGGHCVVFNNGAATCDVFPISGSKIDGGLDTAYNIAAGASREFWGRSATEWYSR